MKTIIHSSILLALASSGIAFGAATATTIPVGYETLTLNAGVNYCGLRLQTTPVNAGVLTGVTASPNTVSDTSTTFALTSGTKYILETSPTGYIQLIDGSAAVGGTITTPDNLLAAGVAVGDKYTIRAAATVVSTFGAVPAGLAQGFGGYGTADQLYIPNSSGVLKVYYYDSYGQFVEPNPGPGWYEINADGSTTLINATTVSMSSGYLFGAVGPANVLSNVPSYYTGL